MIHPYAIAGVALAFAGSLAFGGWQTIRLSRCQTAAAEVRAVTAESKASAWAKAATVADRAAALAASIADTVRSQARAESVRIVEVSTSAAERVRTIVREVEVPVGCPVRLPPAVEAEGRAAVLRANQGRE